VTTIAWDGEAMAADKRANVSGSRITVSKIRRGRDGNLVGIAGSMALFEDIFAWLCEGEKRPEAQGEKGDWCEVLEVTAEGRVFRHERLGRFEVQDKQYAVGSGSDFARAAMACGMSAAEAVKLAARFDTATGDGVESMPLREEAQPARRRRR
jgi:hypothetical protein